MKTFLFIVLSVFLLTACSSSGSKQEKSETDVSISEEHLTHLHLAVEGMTCEGCEQAITANVNKLEGIQEATASHTQAEAMIVFDSTLTDVQAIARAIEDAGYTVKGESADPHH